MTLLHKLPIGYILEPPLTDCGASQSVLVCPDEAEDVETTKVPYPRCPIQLRGTEFTVHYGRGNPSRERNVSRRQGSKDNPHKQTLSGRAFTAADVRLMLSSPVYAYGINLQPAERVAEEVMKLNAQLAQVARETGVTFTLDDLDQRFQALLRQLEDSGRGRHDVDCPPIITKEQWLQAQWVTIQKLARGEEL